MIIVAYPNSFAEFLKKTVMSIALQMIEFLMAMSIKKMVYLKYAVEFIIYVGIFSGTFPKSLIYFYQINYAI